MMINIYAPNKDSSNFFMNVFESISKHQAADRIIAGDFNLVLEEGMDSINRKQNNCKSKVMLKEYMKEALLIDIYRDREPEGRKMMHTCRKPIVAARMDFFLINYGMQSYVTEVDILPAFKSDHSIVLMNVNLYQDQKKGPGFWKLNVSILKDIKNLKRVNEKIDIALQKTKQCKEDVIWEYTKKK